jgi:hypothetical protein
MRQARFESVAGIIRNSAKSGAAADHCLAAMVAATTTATPEKEVRP